MGKRLTWETWLFLALVLLRVAVLWFFPYFPSQDGPAHLENAAILRDYHQPDRPALRTFYELSDRYDPNWAGHLILRALLAILPPLAAEKVLLSGYLLLLPLACWYALEGVRPGAGPIAALVLPMVPNFFYHMGFHNFCYSLGFYFLVLGYFFRSQNTYSWRAWIVQALLILALYFCHLVSLVMAALTVGTVGLMRVLSWGTEPTGSGASENAPLGGRVLRHLVGPFLTFLPALALGTLFLGRQGTQSASEFTTLELFDRLRQMDALLSYLNLEYPISQVLLGIFIISCLGLLIRRIRRGEAKADPFLVVTGLSLVAYFFAPSALAGGSFLNTRLSLFPFFTLILWIGSFSLSRIQATGLLLGGALLSLAFLGCHALAYAEFHRYLAEYAEVEPLLEADRTLLPLSFRHRLLAGGGRLASARVGVFRHAAGYAATRVGVIDLENYEANTGYFPVRFRPEVNPFLHLNPEKRGVDVGLQGEPPEVDLAGYERKTGQRIDFVLLWQVLPEHANNPVAQKLLAQVEAGYDRVFTSSGGLVRLYRRRGD